MTEPKPDFWDEFSSLTSLFLWHPGQCELQSDPRISATPVNWSATSRASATPPLLVGSAPPPLSIANSRRRIHPVALHAQPPKPSRFPRLSLRGIATLSNATQNRGHAPAPTPGAPCSPHFSSNLLSLTTCAVAFQTIGAFERPSRRNADRTAPASQVRSHPARPRPPRPRRQDPQLPLGPTYLGSPDSQHRPPRVRETGLPSRHSQREAAGD